MNDAPALLPPRTPRVNRMSDDFRSQPLWYRFYQGFTIDTATECWNWNAAIKETGYGKISDGGKHLRAHRVSFELHIGPIPKGLDACHRCDNRRCVNPEHLFAGTRSENMQDAKAKGRLKRDNPKRGEEIGTSKLTEALVLQIRASGLSTRKLAAQMNLSQSAISHIKTRRLWKHVQ